MPLTRERRPVLMSLMCIDVYTDREVCETGHSGVNQVMVTSGEQEDKASSSFSPWA